MTTKQAILEADIAYFEQCLQMPSDTNIINVMISKQICARAIEALKNQCGCASSCSMVCEVE